MVNFSRMNFEGQVCPTGQVWLQEQVKRILTPVELSQVRHITTPVKRDRLTQ